MRAGISVTVRRADAALEAWMLYHAAIGFERLFVFCDEGEPKATGAVPGATIVYCDENHWNQFSSHPLYADLDPERSAHTSAWRAAPHVMMRQAMNADKALDRAREESLDWLLHIDGDELFYARAENVEEHFTKLAALGIRQVRYLNVEAVVPAEKTESDDVFGEYTIFRKNPATLSRMQRVLTERSCGGRPWFFSYTNGKSATRVAAGVTVSGVHNFRSDGFVGQCLLSQPAILHYPYSSFSRFREKHEAMGRFDTSRFLGEHWRPPMLISLAQQCIGQGEQAFRRLYQEWLVTEASVIQEMLAAGAMEKITKPAALMRSLREPARRDESAQPSEGQR